VWWGGQSYLNVGGGERKSKKGGEKWFLQFKFFQQRTKGVNREDNSREGVVAGERLTLREGSV